MKSNREILEETAQGANKMLIAMREAQLVVLNEFVNRYGIEDATPKMLRLIGELKSELLT